MSTDLPESNELPLVMLVDDDECILNSLKQLLREEPYQVVSANSGVDGLQMLDTIGRRVSVIVSDFSMPGMTGIEFLKKVREKCPDTVRLVLSGNTDTPAMRSAVTEGHVYKLLSKPWDDDELKAVVLDGIDRCEKVGSTRAMKKEVDQVPAQSTFALWQEIVNVIPAAILGIDADGLVVLANTRVQPILGLDQWSLLGYPAVDVLPADLAATVRPVVAGVVPGRTKKTSVNGRELQIECVPLSGSLETTRPRGALLLAFLLA